MTLKQEVRQLLTEAFKKVDSWTIVEDFGDHREPLSCGSTSLIFKPKDRTLISIRVFGTALAYTQDPKCSVYVDDVNVGTIEELDLKSHISNQLIIISTRNKEKKVYEALELLRKNLE